MAGCEVGPESGKVGVLFGGCNGSEYFDDIMLIKESEDGSYELHVVRLDGDKPPPRAFSSFCVCGDNNQYIVICGGCDNNRVFDDIWVLDTTKSIPALSGSAEQVAPAKAGKGTKAPAVEELMKWTQLSTQLPSERFQHSSYSFKKNDGNYAVRISGGLNRAGPLDCTPVEFTLTFGAGTPKEVTGCELTSNVTVLGRRYCGTNCTVQENGNVVGAFLFGGISDTAIPEIGFMSVSVDGASQFADRARAIIDQRKVDLDTTAAAANEELTFDRVATEFIEYPNGDKYDGEVFRPPQSGEDDGARCVPHGKGRMRFSNGSLYEVNIINV